MRILSTVLGERIEMSKSFRESLNKRLENPDFRREYEASEPEFQLVRAMLDARESRHLTQKQLSEITGITQADISRMENGSANPSLQTLKRLAAGMGMRVKVEFVPAGQ